MASLLLGLRAVDRTPPPSDGTNESEVMMQPRKILVVEDSQLLQKGYELLFRRYRSKGAEILHALNGQEGLDELGKNPDCDLIILDINMPVMSGLEFLARCKRQPAYSRIPVIISSTEGHEDDVMRGLKAGAAGYLVKPFNADELHDLISRIEAPVKSRPVVQA